MITNPFHRRDAAQIQSQENGRSTLADRVKKLLGSCVRSFLKTIFATPSIPPLDRSSPFYKSDHPKPSHALSPSDDPETTKSPIRLEVDEILFEMSLLDGTVDRRTVNVSPWRRLFLQFQSHVAEELYYRNALFYGALLIIRSSICLNFYIVVILFAFYRSAEWFQEVIWTGLLAICGIIYFLYIVVTVWKEGVPLVWLAMRSKVSRQFIVAVNIVGTSIYPLADFYFANRLSDVAGPFATCGIVALSCLSGVSASFRLTLLYVSLELVICLWKALFIAMAWKSALGAVLYTIPILMSCLLVLDGTYSQDKSRRINFLKEQLAERQLEGLQLDRTKTEQLLSLVLPPSIVDKLRHCETSSFDSAANWIKSATVMFMDLSNYYELAAKLGSKRDTTVLLNMIFYEVDKVLRKFPEIERIKAVKTKLIFLGGLGSANHLQEMINFALDVRKTLSKKVLLEIPSDGNGGVKTLRASLKFAFGLQTGPLMTGIVGKKVFCFEVYGDTVNTASRMLSIAKSGQIVVPATTWYDVAHAYKGADLGLHFVKGKGFLNIYNIETLSRRRSSLLNEMAISAMPSDEEAQGPNEDSPLKVSSVPTPRIDPKIMSRSHNSHFAMPSSVNRHRGGCRDELWRESGSMQFDRISESSRLLLASQNGSERSLGSNNSRSTRAESDADAGRRRLLTPLTNKKVHPLVEPQTDELTNNSHRPSPTAMSKIFGGSGAAAKTIQTKRNDLANAYSKLDKLEEGRSFTSIRHHPYLGEQVDKKIGDDRTELVATRRCDVNRLMNEERVEDLQRKISADLNIPAFVEGRASTLGDRPSTIDKIPTGASADVSGLKSDAEVAVPSQSGHDLLSIGYIHKEIGLNAEFVSPSRELEYRIEYQDTIWKITKSNAMKGVGLQIGFVGLAFLNVYINVGNFSQSSDRGSSQDTRTTLTGSFLLTLHSNATFSAVVTIIVVALCTQLFAVSISMAYPSAVRSRQQILARLSIFNVFAIACLVCFNWSGLAEYRLLVTFVIPEILIVYTFVMISLPMTERAALTWLLAMLIEVCGSFSHQDFWLIPFIPTVLFIVFGGSFVLSESLMRLDFLMDATLTSQAKMTEEEDRKSTHLLKTVLPSRVIESLLLKPGMPVYEEFSMVTVLQMDIMGFTAMSSIVEPVLIFQMINNMFTYFDRLTEEFNTEKITTIGDAYVACSSLEADADPSLGAVSVCLVALQMQSFVMETFNESPFMKAKVNQKCRMRIGVHSGPCHGSIVGGSTNFRYDLIGATVDIAEKIQEQCEPGEVFISAATKRLVEIYKGFEMTEKGLCTSGQELFLLRMIRRKELPEVPPETNVNI